MCVYIPCTRSITPLIFSTLSVGALEANAKKEVGVQGVRCGAKGAGDLMHVKVKRRGSRCSVGMDLGSVTGWGLQGEYSLSLKTEAYPDGTNSRRLSAYSIPHS